MNVVLLFIGQYWKALLVVAVTVVLLAALYVVYGHVTAAAFNKGVATQQKIADDARTQGQAAIAIARDAVEQLATAKEDLAKSKKYYEGLERIFNDSSKNFNDKLKEYERVKNGRVPITDNGTELQSLCERSRANGIRLNVCPE